jgi:hypothetical protein
MPKTCWTVVVAALLVFLLLGYGFGAKWGDPPWGQPYQMRSQVNYDPKLSDPFFNTEKWICPRYKPECEEKDRLKLTAKCFTTFQGKHRISFCDAKLLDGDRIELLIHERTAADNDNLRIIIRDGVFRSQYWHEYLLGTGTRIPAGVRWTTTRQNLTLDKKVYRKGDVIKGKIEFECAEELAYLWLPFLSETTRTITINGVFKTIVE